MNRRVITEAVKALALTGIAIAVGLILGAALGTAITYL